MASKLQVNGPDILAANGMSWGSVGNAITLASLASGSARLGDEEDRGAGPYDTNLWQAYCNLKWNAALTAGVALGALYVLESDSSGAFPGELGGSDAAVAATKLNNLGNQLILAGVCDSTTNGALQIFRSAPFRLNMRYVNIVWYNTAGQAMHATTPGLIQLVPYEQYRTATAA